MAALSCLRDSRNGLHSGGCWSAGRFRPCTQANLAVPNHCRDQDAAARFEFLIDHMPLPARAIADICKERGNQANFQSVQRLGDVSMSENQDRVLQ
jgi:hypothetical protein